MESRGVLLQYETTDNEIFNTSGLMLKKSMVITTGSCLTPIIEKCINLNKPITTATLNNLLKITILFEQPDYKSTNNPNNLNTINTYKNKHKNISNNLTGTFVNLFQCSQIKTTIESSLPDWNINNASQLKNDLCKEFLLSTIVVINVKGVKVEVNDVLRELLASLVPINYLERGDVVYLETTPFGNRTFLNTLSEGVIANTIGKEQCIFLTDASAAPGSEGGPIFMKMKENNRTRNETRTVVGLVLSSVSYWKDEYCGFTLGVSLACVLQQLIRSPYPNNEILFEKPLKLLRPEIVDNSIVQITCGGSCGTGIVIDKPNGLIVTTAHTVKRCDKNIIFGKWKKDLFKLQVLHRTSENLPYDIAILQTKSPILKKLETIKFNKTPPQPGEEVMAFGYPFDMIHGGHSNNLPTVSQGVVSKVTPCMLQTTCCIHRGVSGGGIIRPNGELLAIVVCIIADDETETSYPQINMCVPAKIIQDAVNLYLKNNDVQAFKILETNDVQVNKMWNLFISHL